MELHPTEPELNLEARVQALLDRIAPLSADLAAHGRTRALALKKLRRICDAEVRIYNVVPATLKLIETVIVSQLSFAIEDS